MAENENPYRPPESTDSHASEESAAYELVTIANYWDGNEAQLARMHLESFDVRSFIAGEAMSSMFWQYNNAIGGVRLQVAQHDAERARKILSAAIEIEDEHERAAFSDDPEEDSLNAREQNADRALRGALVGMLLPPLELYVVWLLIKVFVSQQPLRDRQRRHAIVATVVCSLSLVFYYVLLRGRFT
jgi:hypothetical protein